MILWIVFGVFVGFGALVGLIRGLNKATVRLMTLVVAAALTFAIAAPVAKAVAANVMIEGMTLGELLLDAISGSDVEAFFEVAPLLKEAVLVLPTFAIGIVMFPVMFFVLKGFTWIVFLFVQKPLRKLIFKDNCNKAEEKASPAGIRVAKRFGGLGVGAVTGVLIFAMILTPVLGLISVLPERSAMDTALDALVEQDILSSNDVDSIKEAYAYLDAPVLKFYSTIGIRAAGRSYLHAVSKIEAGGYSTSLVNEFASLMGMIQTTLESGLLDVLLSPEDPNAIFELLSDKEFVDHMMQNMFESEMLRAAFSEVVAMAMEGVADSMGVPANKDAVYDNMMDAIAAALKDAGIDYAAIQAYEEANGITFSAAGLSAPKKVMAPATGMSQEEYEAALEKLLELTTTISEILGKSLAGSDADFANSVAVEIINGVKTQAAESGLEVVLSYNAADVQGVIANIDASNVSAGEGNADTLLQQLTDKEKFETDMVTVENIKDSIRESVKNAFADEEKAAETASTLAAVVSDFAAAVSSATDEEGNIDVTKMDFEKVASAVTSLQNSPLKDVGSAVLDIVASGDLGDNSMLGDALGAVKEGYEKGEDIGGTISSAGALIGLGSAMSGENGADQEAMVNSLTSLINNLNEFTIGLLPTILSVDTIASMGVPEEYAAATYSVIETMLKELMKLKGAENYDSEVNAILSLYNLATSGMEDFTEEDIPQLAGYLMESDAIFNTLVSISTSNPFGIEIEDAATRKELVEGIETYFAESGKTQRERDICTAIATILGVEGDLKLG